MIPEDLLLKHQLIIRSRSLQRAPNLTTEDRALLGFLSLFLNPRRIARSAILIRPSTLLSFYKALTKRKYQLMYSPRGGKKRGPKAPSREVIDQYTRRFIGFSAHAGNVDGPNLCRMFNHATSGQGWPKYLSSDNDPLFQYHRWKADLRVLEVEEVKSLPHVPLSHPFVERLIGSIRREMLDHTLFWTTSDLENRLRNYQYYYNENRCHSGRDGATPVNSRSAKVVDINAYRWQKHCRGLFQLPVAA